MSIGYIHLKAEYQNQAYCDIDTMNPRYVILIKIKELENNSIWMLSSICVKIRNC